VHADHLLVCYCAEYPYHYIDPTAYYASSVDNGRQKAATDLLHLTQVQLSHYHSTPKHTTTTNPREALDTWQGNTQRNLVRRQDHLENKKKHLYHHPIHL